MQKLEKEKKKEKKTPIMPISDLDGFTIGSDVMDTFAVEASLSTMFIDPMNIEQENKCTEIVHEGLYMHIFCVVDEKNKCSGCNGVVAMKTLTDQFPDPKQIKKLDNKYKLSHHLSKLSFIRPALKLVEKR
eukprot:3888493-Ditylum_brightwellii.AAC.1